VAFQNDYSNRPPETNNFNALHKAYYQLYLFTIEYSLLIYYITQKLLILFINKRAYSQRA